MLSLGITGSQKGGDDGRIDYDFTLKYVLLLLDARRWQSYFKYYETQGGTGFWEKPFLQEECKEDAHKLPMIIECTHVNPTTKKRYAPEWYILDYETWQNSHPHPEGMRRDMKTNKLYRIKTIRFSDCRIVPPDVRKHIQTRMHNRIPPVRTP